MKAFILKTNRSASFANPLTFDYVSKGVKRRRPSNLIALGFLVFRFQGRVLRTMWEEFVFGKLFFNEFYGFLVQIFIPGPSQVTMHVVCNHHFSLLTADGCHKPT